MSQLPLRASLILAAALVACAPPEGRGLARTPLGTGATVRFDVYAKPFAEVPLPNDFATRFDASSPTRHRLNASLEANTFWERAARESIDKLDGWGTYQAATVAFDKPLDLLNIVKRHVGDDYDPRDDVAYIIDITPDSPDFCERVPLDMGEGNFPLVLKRPDYFTNDRPGDNFAFEDREEDANHNGVLDLGEDLDMDGVLDHPNLLYPGARTFDVMPFYERETNTLIMKPVMPLRENTTYAVVLTRRLVDEDGRPVRSPFDYINHASQTRALESLPRCLPKYDLSLDDVAFTWAYTTQSITRDYKAIRDGLYGLGTMQRLAEEFPSDVELLPVRDRVAGSPQINVRIVPGAVFQTVAEELFKAATGSSTITPALQTTLDSHKFVDFYAVFTFTSPQFFPRTDSEGNMLPLYKQEWDVNALTGAAFTRPEKITAFLTVPKQRTGPAPVVILGHGYTGMKIDPLMYGGFLARYGLASIGMEDVSHGVPLNATDKQLVTGLLAGKGLEALAKALLDNHRAYDWDGDGVPDSGADFWTSYMPHTRDVVKQSAIDYMQLVRVLRSFDGGKKWAYGSKIAGDFDADGVIDIGGSAPIHMLGGSLGGIMSSLMSGLEPQLDIAVPIAGAAGLADVGIRSEQGGVREAVNLRMLAPLMVSIRNAEGKLDLWQILPSLNETGKVKLGPIDANPADGDTVVLWNLGTEKKRQFSWWKKEYRCARVAAGGLWRAAVPADEGDELRIELYRGALPPQVHEGCRIPEGARPSWQADSAGYDYQWWTTRHLAGEPIIALGDGFGMRRQSPETRTFMGLGQVLVDSADPINTVPFAEQHRILRYGTGETVSTHLMILNTVGDMNVPVAAGASIARAAGFLDLYNKDPRYGATDNRVLIDHGTIEGVWRTGRYPNSSGELVLMDIDNLADIPGTGDGFDVPRLNPPMRLVKHSDRIGGYSGILWVMATPQGRHAFDGPDPSKVFDIGSFIMNMLGRYVTTNAEELPLLPCNANSSCPWTPPVP